MNERMAVLSEIKPYLEGYAEPVTSANGRFITYSEERPELLLSDCKYSKSEIEQLLKDNLSGGFYDYYKQLLDANTAEKGGKFYFVQAEDGVNADKIGLPKNFPDGHHYTVMGDFSDGDKQIFYHALTASGEEVLITFTLANIDGVYKLDRYTNP